MKTFEPMHFKIVNLLFFNPCPSVANFFYFPLLCALYDLCG